MNPSNPILTRRAALATAGAAALWAASPVFAAESALPVPASLREVGLAAAAKGEPLVLLISLPGCPFCELARRSYLLPMREEGLQAWQVSVTDHTKPVRDFQNVASTGEALARRWNATYTPTVLFFDADGKEVADRLVGIAVPDFYGAYLDQALSAARTKLARTR